MRQISQKVRKLDAQALVTGMPVYTQDIVQGPYLTVKIVRSPHAHAKILSVDTSKAMKVPGAACVLTHRDVPHVRHTLGGYAYAGSNPYDRLVLEDRVRFVGDAAAIVAAETAEAAERMARLVKVEYKVLPAVLDMDTAEEAPAVVHPEEDYVCKPSIRNDNARNVLACGESGNGDVEKVFSQCDVVLEDEYHTLGNSQCMMETFRSYSFYDKNRKLTVISSTQIPFLVRRTIAYVFGLPISTVRVIKPKVGGGFGAKQSLVTELFGAAVTIKTGLPAMVLFDRRESFTATTTRHEMKLRVKMGAMRDGTVRAVSLYVRENAGAYGDHAMGCVGLSGHKSLPMLGKAEAYSFRYDVLYTNLIPGGAFRGYGATQGCFAVESMVNKMAHALGMDPIEMRLKNIPMEGEVMPAYYGETLTSSHLDRCIRRGKEMIGWDEKYPRRQTGSHTVRAVGMAASMQGSGIGGVDKCFATVRLDEDGCYTVLNGAGDMGTGCDTILAQIAAEVLETDISNVHAAAVDTDYSPYDKGSFASATTYVTGMAVVKACERLIGQMMAEAAAALETPEERLVFQGDCISEKDAPENRISVSDLARRQVTSGNCHAFTATCGHMSQTSPPPLMAGFVEIELDTQTGQVKVLDYAACIDCGTVINANLARVQAEGGIVQGIGMALYENMQFSSQGKMRNNSFLQYKIPSRLDVPPIRVAFDSSYEPTGPFGAKSIGEIVINTPAPAIADAIYNACGVYMTELPFLPERVLNAINNKAE